MDYEINLSTVDAIITKGNQILLIQRKNSPFKGSLALPGGFVEFGERVEDAVKREIKEEVQLEIMLQSILGAYYGKNRDPRGPVISIVFIFQIQSGEPKAADDAASVDWYALDNLNMINLAFDHRQILENYLNWRKNSDLTYWSSKLH